MDKAQFTIKTEVFEGPLELLLTMIEKRKFFINDISLAKVADDYIEYVKKIGELPMNLTSHFILVASTLLLIKSKSLLPQVVLTVEEEESISDLENRLFIYKKFKELSVKISKIFGNKIIYAKNPSKNTQIVFSPEDSITVMNIRLSAKNVIESLPKQEVLPKTVIDKIISLETMIERLTEKIQNSLKLNFSDFTKGQGGTKNQGARHSAYGEDKKNIIISFLAVLELVKRGIISVTQNNLVDEIEIETKDIAVPNYQRQ